MTLSRYLEGSRLRLTELAGFGDLDPGSLPAVARSWASMAVGHEAPGRVTALVAGPVMPEAEMAALAAELSRAAQISTPPEEAAVLVVVLAVAAETPGPAELAALHALSRQDGHVRLVVWVADLDTGRLHLHQGQLSALEAGIAPLLAPVSALAEGAPAGTRPGRARMPADEEPVFRPLFTYGLLGLIAAVWAAMSIAGGSFDATRSIPLLVQWGAVGRPDLWTTGEYWRLLSATFLHIGIEHLFMNGISLWSVGRIVEAFFGRGKLLFIFLTAGVAGSALSAMIGPPVVVSAGASGAIFGLLGAVIWFRISAPAGRHIPWRPLLMTLGLNLAFGLALHDMIDNWNHLGGLFGGFTAAAVVGAPELAGMGRPRLRLPRPLRATGAALLAAAMLAVLTGQIILPGPGRELAGAVTLHDQGHYAEAEAAYRSLLRRQPDEPSLHALLTDALIRQRKCEQARLQLAELAELAPRHRSTLLLGQDLTEACGR